MSIMYFIFFLYVRLPPVSTRTDTLFPSPALFRSRLGGIFDEHHSLGLVGRRVHVGHVVRDDVEFAPQGELSRQRDIAGVLHARSRPPPESVLAASWCMRRASRFRLCIQGVAEGLSGHSGRPFRTSEGFAG